MLTQKDRKDEQFWMNSAIELASLVSDMEDREAEDNVEHMFQQGAKALLEMAEAKIRIYSHIRKEQPNTIMSGLMEMQTTLKKWIDG